MIAVDSIEQRLLDAYRCQGIHYDEALRIVNEDTLILQPALWSDCLQSVLRQIAHVEQDIVPDKLAWTMAGRLPGPELRSILAGVATKIQELSAAIDRRSDEFLAKKQRLLPMLDGFIRHRQMLQCYAQSGKTQ